MRWPEREDDNMDPLQRIIIWPQLSTLGVARVSGVFSYTTSSLLFDELVTDSFVESKRGKLH